jgi:hypothetical protein
MSDVPAHCERPARASLQSPANKAKFLPDEDARLLDLVEQAGPNKDWSKICKMLGTRSARPCRERYQCYLNPNMGKEFWTAAEDQLLRSQVELHGTQWDQIARCFQNHSPMSLRNRWKLISQRPPVCPIVLPVLDDQAAATKNQYLKVMDIPRSGERVLTAQEFWALD